MVTTHNYLANNKLGIYEVTFGNNFFPRYLFVNSKRIVDPFCFNDCGFPSSGRHFFGPSELAPAAGQRNKTSSSRGAFLSG